MPFAVGKEPASSWASRIPVGAKKYHGTVLSEEEATFNGHIIDSTYHYNFVIPLGELADRCGLLRNAYVYNGKIYCAIWKEDYKAADLPPITEDSFKVGKNAFK
jgi:hypothetical protein